MEIPVKIPLAGLVPDAAFTAASGGEDFLYADTEAADANAPVTETDLV